MIRILNVEDDAVVRRGLAQLLSAPGTGFSVVASCASAEEALERIEGGLDFELAIVDLGLPGKPGTEVIRAVRRVRPSATALAFTVFDDAASIFDALRAGATGYLLKDTPPERLFAALHEALAGGAPMTPSIARRVVESFAPRKPVANVPFEPLTPRELDVLERLTQGETYAVVARTLGVGLSTVQGYVKSIYRKLEVNSKAEATAVALTRGLVTR